MSLLRSFLVLSVVAAACICAVQAHASHRVHRHLTTKPHSKPTPTTPETHLHPHRAHRIIDPNDVSVYFYPANQPCSNAAIVEMDVQPGVCTTGLPTNTFGYQSLTVLVNNQTNFYELELFYDTSCDSFGTSAVGQGNACNQAISQFNSFQVVSPIVAPCVYKMYADAECFSFLDNSFGMTPGTCTESTLAERIYVAADQQSNSFSITGYPVASPKGCSGFSVFQYTGQLGQCVNNATLECTF